VLISKLPLVESMIANGSKVPTFVAVGTISLPQISSLKAEQSELAYITRQVVNSLNVLTSTVQRPVQLADHS